MTCLWRLGRPGGKPLIRSLWLLWQPCVLDREPHIAAGRYYDRLVHQPGQGWRYRRKQVAFDYFTPLQQGWAPARFSLPAAAATHRSTTAAMERP